MAPIVTALIPILVPMVVSQIKKFNMPKWLIPVLSMLLGAATEVTAQLAGGVSVTTAAPIDGGMLGLAGVGIREIYNQITKK